MIVAILKQAGRIGGHVAWTCQLSDGSRLDLTIREVMFFNRAAA